MIKNNSSELLKRLSKKSGINKEGRVFTPQCTFFACDVTSINFGCSVLSGVDVTIKLRDGGLYLSGDDVYTAIGELFHAGYYSQQEMIKVLNRANQLHSEYKKPD